MLATNSKFDAIRYQEAFEEYDDIKTAVIMSPPDDREGYEEIDQEPKDRVIKYWNKMIEGYDNPIKYEERIKNEFVHGDEIDILIVIDKLLTGFDAPRASVMYIDKPLKEHSLLQAIARVNRLYDGKDYGLIVDYRGLIKELDSALQTYSGAGLENYDKEDLKGALVDVIFILGKLRESYSHLLDIFRTVKNQNDNEEYELILANDSVRKNFYNQLSLFGRYLGIALESEHVYYALNEVELRTYKNHFKFFQELRASVKLRYSDTLDNKEYESKMRNLMDTYIAAEEVVIISKPADILSEKEFEEELNKLGSKRAKADAIATRLTKSIHLKYNENPAFYQKFSEKIEEIIKQYKEQRISDADYFARMEEVKMNYRKGYSGEHYPRSIKNNSNCQAFYGVLKNQLVSFLNIEKENNDDFNEMIAEISIEVNSIIDKNSKIDWHDNLDVHKKITSELNDMFFMIRKKKIKSLSFSLIDQIINDIKTVALRRY